ncbi:hypothetical protein AB0H77_08510 [Streptomyces sp. NPDC050844]|uniref:hypothetical protein n=1 Tax=Streptomyces sp. NPDC050844 TaxID=3155790 RepID=UPI0033E168A6
MLRLSGVGRIQGGDSGEGGPAPGLKIVVCLPEAASEGIARVRVLGLTEDVALTARDVVESALMTLPLGLALLHRAYVRVTQVSSQECPALRAEDTIGKEGPDGLKEIGLVDVEGLGVPGVDVRAATIVGPGPARPVPVITE